MKKTFLLLLSLLSALLCGLGLAACSEEEHDWNTEVWKHNGQEHWHACNNRGCNERTDVTPHEDWELVEEIVPANCYTRGRGIYACTVCGQTKEDIIPPTGEHIYDETTPWLADENGHYRICTVLGCVERDYHPHDNLKERILELPGQYTNGLKGFACFECDYLVRSEIMYATGVPYSMDVQIQIDKDAAGSSWAADDIDPIPEYDNLPVYDEIKVSVRYTVPYGARSTTSTSGLYFPFYAKPVTMWNKAGQEVYGFPEYNGWDTTAYDPGMIVRGCKITADGTPSRNWEHLNSVTSYHHDTSGGRRYNFNCYEGYRMYLYNSEVVDWLLCYQVNVPNKKDSVRTYIVAEYYVYLHVVSYEEYRSIRSELKAAQEGTDEIRAPECILPEKRSYLSQR